MKRVKKLRIISDLLNGRLGSLESLHLSRERDPARMSDHQLRAEISRCHLKIFRETGVMPPPTPNFSAMTVEELQAYRNERRANIALAVRA